MNLSPKNITRIKNVTNTEIGKAYLDIEDREFILHFPDRLKNSVLEADKDELIILYQRASRNEPRYLTHMVKPIDNELIEEKTRNDYRFGRVVEIIAYPGEEYKIPFSKSPLFDVDLRNRGWGNAELLSNVVPNTDLERTQNELWELFLPFFDHTRLNNSKDHQTFLNDELNQDFETKEGKELFRNHRIRERDSSISVLKKELALKEGNLKCEVCKFSFQERYAQDYIECHHIIPISSGERITRLKDLALVCSNCHRMLHRQINGNYPSMDELKELVDTRPNMEV